MKNFHLDYSFFREVSHLEQPPKKKSINTETKSRADHENGFF